MSGFIPKHGLTRNTKRLVFDALYQRQQGKCFLCGRSQEEIRKEKYLARHRNADTWKLFIDHCHWTGRIRGLLCEMCNSWIAFFEDYAFQEKPDGLSEESFANYCIQIGQWIEEHREALFQYMQRDRWLPQKDILFHLQMQEVSA